MAPRIVYDNETEQQTPNLQNLAGSVAAIIGYMVSATDNFDIRNKDDRTAVKDAFTELMQPWFESVLKAQATLGREKV